MKRLDLSKEIEDDELTGLIFRVLAEESEMEYIPLQKKVSLGRELFNVFENWMYCRTLLKTKKLLKL